MSDIQSTPPPTCPSCPTCGEPMEHHGGTVGYLHCEWKLLYKAGGWIKDGKHIADSRLAGGDRRVDGHEITYGQGTREENQ